MPNFKSQLFQIIYITIWINMCSLDVVIVSIMPKPYILGKIYFNELFANAFLDKKPTKID